MIYRLKSMRMLSLILVMSIGITAAPINAEHKKPTWARKAINVIISSIFVAGGLAGIYATSPKRTSGQSTIDYLKSYKSLGGLQIISLLGCCATAAVSTLNIVDTIQQ